MPPPPPIPTPTARAGYVTNNGSDSITVIDLESGATTDVSLDLDPSAHEAPHHLAADAHGDALFVALAFPPVAPSAAELAKDPHAAHGRAATTGVLARLKLGTLAVDAMTDVDENPGDVVLTHDRSRVLVTHFDMRRALAAAAEGAAPSAMFATLQVWDAKKLTKLAERRICVAPHGVVTTRDDKRAFVACYGSDELAVVDLASEGLPTAHYPVAAAQGVLGAPRWGPYSVVLSPDESLAIVSDLEGQDLHVFDVAARTFVEARTITLGARAFMSAFTPEGSLLVPLQSPDGVARIDVARGVVEKRATFDKAACEAPHVVRVRGDAAWVVCEGDHRGPGAVLAIDPRTLEVHRRIRVGVYPDGLAFGTD